MSRWPSIPVKGTDQNSKLFLDSLAGRMGIENQVVTMGDLFNTGIIELAPGVSIGDLDPNNPGSGITIPTTDLPDSPTTPKNLGVVGAWGAVLLSWDYSAYNDEYGTEIWRSPVNDRATAVLIAVGKGRSYTDNVGEKATFFYWIRNRSIAGIVSGYNQLDGVQGDSNLITTAEDFVMANPDAEFVPFTIANYGTEAIPDWKILLNGQVIITSDLSIGQLITGEMRPNTTFTIGNGSIQMGTDGNGKGYMIVTGDNGITGNDYLYLNAGALDTWIYDPNSGQHVKYKELKRVERGITSNGSETIIPPYFRSEPLIQLSFEDISVYNPDYQSQAQSLQMSVGAVLPVEGVVGSYTFTPTAVLALSDGSRISVENLTANTTANTGATLTSALVHNNGRKFTGTFTVSSSKHFDASNFQNRQILITMQGSLNGGAYTTLGSTNVLLTGDGVSKTAAITSATLTIGTWTIRYIFAPSDRSGTTPSGGADYIYTNQSVNSGTILSLENTPSSNSVTGLPQVVNPSIPVGGELFEIDYAVDYSAKGEAWKLCYKDCTDLFPKTVVGDSYANVTGEASLKTSSGTGDATSAVVGLCNIYPGTGEISYRTNSASGTAGTGGKISITPNSEPYISGRYTNTNWEVKGLSIASELIGTGGCLVGYTKAEITITAYRVTYYYRTPVTVDTTARNSFKVDTIAADLGATDISINDAVINWIAFGE